MRMKAILSVLSCLAVIVFAVAGFRACSYVHRLLTEPLPSGVVRWCGNSYIDPICYVLSLHAPIAGLTVVAMFVLSKRLSVRKVYPVGLLAVWIFVLLVILAFSFRILSDLVPTIAWMLNVWWLRPFSSLFRH